MKLEILQVPHCPNVAVLEDRIRQATAGHPIVLEISHRVIDDPDDAAAAGMAGSPTLLVDGVDPFAVPGQVPSVACRLYRSESGGIDGAPTVGALRAALQLEPIDAPDDSRAAGDCCAPSDTEGSLAPGLTTWRRAAQPADPAEKEIHQAVLRGFAATGRPPSATELARIAARFDVLAESVLARLHAADVIRLDAAGAIASAYPFSTSPTRHRVRITNGATVYAMCAVDALGVPAMLGTDAVVISADPSTSEPVEITIRDGELTAQPATTVVFLGARAGEGPSADSCCNDLNFFTDRDTAQRWSDAHPHLDGTILDLAAARRLGEDIFGAQLSATSDHPATLSRPTPPQH
ncbi:alkylmercury lyase family protein [Nocardia sp. NPDC059228]|uniref:alkylmercury lyase family protein n=1 Tax=Nocardia sp. NPDC059228 TaxID=3346777 RepID=UPI00368B2069